MSASHLAQFHRATEYYRETARLIDETLYELCRNHPGHSSRDAINAKIHLIGRTYATGIERKIRSRRFQGSAMEWLCDHLCARRKELDRLIKPLAKVHESLSVANLAVILGIHGELLDLIRPALRPGQTPRSFVSKYLHFHCPAVPIYDSVAERELKKLVRWERSMGVFPMPSSADGIYYRYCMRFWRLHESLRTEGAAVTVKALDNFILWQERERR